MEERGVGDDLGVIADVGTELQGVLDSYPNANACGGNDQQDKLATMVNIQGMEPIGTVEFFFFINCLRLFLPVG